MTIMPTLLDDEDAAAHRDGSPGSGDPGGAAKVFQNLKPLSRWQRFVLNVSAFLLMPLMMARIFLVWWRGDDANAVHRRVGKTDGR
jgi:hypothetical protein